MTTLPHDTVMLSSVTAQALTEHAGLGDFSTTEQPERMAWVARVLRHRKDDPKLFPRGKSATIQEIDRQVDEAAHGYLGEDGSA